MKLKRTKINLLPYLFFICFLFIGGALSAQNNDYFNVESPLESYSISFENPTGAKGKGGTAASPLGVGRKGLPAKILAPKEEVLLADIKGNGTIRHIWMTTFSNPVVLRSGVIRIYWDGQEHPSVEVPWGDFFGFAHGFTPAFESAVHSVGERAGMNFWLPMPFTKSAKVTFVNDATVPVPLFYQIDYTLGDNHKENVGRMHILFKRALQTTKAQDFEILPLRKGKGRYIGTTLGVRVEDKKWWGEGEVKMYIDGDKEFPTICGTGSEDYVGLSWGMQETPLQFHGANLNRNGFTSMYRWHLPDPILWKEDIRVTIQQIGHKGESSNPQDYFNQLYEREDDWSATTYWYEAIPSAALPAFPSLADRTAKLYTGNKAQQKEEVTANATKDTKILIEKWLQLWASYDLNLVPEIFWQDERTSYFSSEKEGLIKGYKALIPHHEGFGFVKGGKKPAKSLWLEEGNIMVYQNSIVYSGIWYFGDKNMPKDKVQKGPVTFVIVRDKNDKLKIAHTHFANY
jgi:hypothetical protein